MARHDWPAQGLVLKHFDRSEFDHPGEMDREFLRRLDRLRQASGIAIRITSDYRTEEENERIGGHPNSPHLRGLAVDCQPVPNNARNRMQLVRTALDLWAEGQFEGLGLGIYDRHLHCDQDSELKRPFMWVGESK